MENTVIQEYIFADFQSSAIRIGHTTAFVFKIPAYGIHITALQTDINALLRCFRFVYKQFVLPGPNRVFLFPALDHDPRNSAFCGNRYIKISGFKHPEQSAELKAHIKGIVHLLSMVSQKSSRKRTGIEATNANTAFFYTDLLDTRRLAGVKSPQLPTISADQKHRSQQDSYAQQADQYLFHYFHIDYLHFKKRRASPQ